MPFAGLIVVGEAAKYWQVTILGAGGCGKVCPSGCETVQAVMRRIYRVLAQKDNISKKLAGERGRGKTANHWGFIAPYVEEKAIFRWSVDLC